MTLTPQDFAGDGHLRVRGAPAAPPPAGEARTDARELIRGLLADGAWHDASPILSKCEQAGVYARAAQRAADDLGVEHRKEGFPAVVYWRRRGASSGAMPEATPPIPVVPGGPVASVASADRALIDRGDINDRDASGDDCRLSVVSEGESEKAADEPTSLDADAEWARVTAKLGGGA